MIGIIQWETRLHYAGACIVNPKYIALVDAVCVGDIYITVIIYFDFAQASQLAVITRAGSIRVIIKLANLIRRAATRQLEFGCGSIGKIRILANRSNNNGDDIYKTISIEGGICNRSPKHPHDF